MQFYSGRQRVSVQFYIFHDKKKSHLKEILMNTYDMFGE